MGPTTVDLAFQDRGNGNYDDHAKTITTEWQRFSITITTGGGATSNTLIGWENPTHSRTFYFWGWQVEQKGYATPYVVSQHLDPTAQGPSARPASVNLMIHGNVGSWHRVFMIQAQANIQSLRMEILSIAVRSLSSVAVLFILMGLGII